MGGHHRSIAILDFFIFWPFLAIFWPFLHFWGIFAFLSGFREPVSYNITRGIREGHLGGLGGF